MNIKAKNIRQNLKETMLLASILQFNVVNIRTSALLRLI